MSELAAFCNQLISFFEDLSETYPEEKDIAAATQKLKFAKRANPRLVHGIFMKNVYAEFSDKILDEDEDYILARVKDNAELGDAFWIFDKHWSTMSETNKQHVWAYIKTIVLLASRVASI